MFTALLTLSSFYGRQVLELASIPRQQICRGPVSIPSLGVPFLIRGDSSWAQDSRPDTVTVDRGASTPVKCFTCIAERTRRKSAPASGDDQNQEAATGGLKFGAVDSPKSDGNAGQGVQRGKRKREPSCHRITASEEQPGIAHRVGSRRSSKSNKMSRADRFATESQWHVCGCRKLC